MTRLIQLSKQITAANDDRNPDGTPPPSAVIIDPAIAAWAQDFDHWLDTPEGKAWLRQWDIDHDIFFANTAALY